jgi:hypothetical protein
VSDATKLEEQSLNEDAEYLGAILQTVGVIEIDDSSSLNSETTSTPQSTAALRRDETLLTDPLGTGFSEVAL